MIKNEAKARKYLLGFCWKNHQPRRWRGHQRFCPRCRSRKLYKLGDGRRRCARCRYTFQDFAGRWINIGGLTAGQWLRVIKLFELELSTRKIAAQLGLAYPAGILRTTRLIKPSIPSGERFWHTAKAFNPAWKEKWNWMNRILVDAEKRVK